MVDKFDKEAFSEEQVEAISKGFSKAYKQMKQDEQKTMSTLLQKKMPSGGARQGAGRKPKEKPLVTKCFRVDEDIFNKAQEIHGKTLNKKINNYLKRLSKKP